MFRKQVLALAAAAVLGTGLSAMAAPITTFTLSITDMSDNPIAASPDGKVHINQGDSFKVVLHSTVATPYTLSSTRGTAVRNKPLGIQTLSTRLVSALAAGTMGDAASANIVNAVNDGGNQQQSGTSYNDMTGFGPAFATVTDLGGDGDQDINGSGFVNVSLTAPTTANGYNNNNIIGLDNDLLSHVFTASTTKLGDVTLRTNTSTLNLYKDPGSGALQASSEIQGLSEGSVQLLVVAVPEPASIGLLGVGALGLLARRRQA